MISKILILTFLGAFACAIALPAQPTPVISTQATVASSNSTAVEITTTIVNSSSKVIPFIVSENVSCYPVVGCLSKVDGIDDIYAYCIAPCIIF